jgi:hypothetical protein
MARCTAHGDREPSLSICDADDGKVLLHAGCGQEWVIGVLRSRGLWVQNGHHYFTRRVARPAANHRLDHDEAKRREAPLAIWGGSVRPPARWQRRRRKSWIFSGRPWQRLCASSRLRQRIRMTTWISAMNSPPSVASRSQSITLKEAARGFRELQRLEQARAAALIAEGVG